MATFQSMATALARERPLQLHGDSSDTLYGQMQGQTQYGEQRDNRRCKGIALLSVGAVFDAAALGIFITGLTEGTRCSPSSQGYGLFFWFVMIFLPLFVVGLALTIPGIILLCKKAPPAAQVVTTVVSVSQQQKRRKCTGITLSAIGGFLVLLTGGLIAIVMDGNPITNSKSEAIFLHFVSVVFPVFLSALTLLIPGISILGMKNLGPLSPQKKSGKCAGIALLSVGALFDLAGLAMAGAGRSFGRQNDWQFMWYVAIVFPVLFFGMALTIPGITILGMVGSSSSAPQQYYGGAYNSHNGAAAWGMRQQRQQESYGGAVIYGDNSSKFQPEKFQSYAAVEGKTGEQCGVVTI